MCWKVISAVGKPAGVGGEGSGHGRIGLPEKLASEPRDRKVQFSGDERSGGQGHAGCGLGSREACVGRAG